uniref:Uncharacterized protein n=1 Tax=Tetranychus urticae TaxID=32264 RepID=T1JR39_TETUR
MKIKIHSSLEIFTKWITYFDGLSNVRLKDGQSFFYQRFKILSKALFNNVNVYNLPKT